MTSPRESILSVLEGQRKLLKVDDKKQITGTFAVMEKFKGYGNDILNDLCSCCVFLILE